MLFYIPVMLSDNHDHDASTFRIVFIQGRLALAIALNVHITLKKCEIKVTC
jgi:hypothetical protein